MPDVLGWRAKFGAIGPSTNTVVQPDYDAMRPVGVTNHYSRIFTPNATLTNDTFRAGVGVISDNVMDAVKSVMTCSPDYLVMGMSAITFFGGAKGADAFVSPYWPVMNEAVIGYFTDMGFSVVRDIALQCTSWTGIADVTPAQCRDALRQLDGDDVDALVQVGTNLSMIRLAAAAELWLGKPVIAINTATYWHALRANGITDRLEGFGRLLAEF
jgi:maleate isomerase